MFSTRFLSAFALLSLLGVNASEGSGQNSRFFKRQNTDCISPDPQNTIADRINAILNAPNAAGVSVKLCPNTEYLILSPLKFGQPKQEIITLGFPSPTMNMTSRAIIKVGGPVANGEGHTIAIDGTCPTCDGVALRYVQIDGDRDDAPPTKGGANIEMGGDNEGQIIEGVRSFNPRSWSCLHLAEGPLSCSGALIQNNDIGPCGQDSFQQWADGISLSCKNSIVRNNYITGATDGGIVIFGSPGSHVYNNTIECKGVRTNNLDEDRTRTNRANRPCS
ncbi:hypothetical protein FRC03_011117 [Tulasnella sp. 419]|nr:hypothetical protein FRC03_011117 [Tulasnella sp. 419]